MEESSGSFEKRVGKQTASFKDDSQVLVPANGNCFFISVLLSYLLPIIHDSDKFCERLDKISGLTLELKLALRDNLIKNYRRMEYLNADSKFIFLINKFKETLGIRGWGGNAEDIRKVEALLKVKIVEVNEGVARDETKGKEEVDEIRVYIFRCTPRPEEISSIEDDALLEQGKIASVASSGEHRHFRVYDFDREIEAAILHSVPLLKKTTMQKSPSNPFAWEDNSQQNVFSQNLIDKNEDLKKLRKCSQIIEQFLTCGEFNEPAKTILLKICSHLSELAFRDTGENCKDYIRNKYGSIDRSDNARRRKGGLEIIHFTAFKILLDQNTSLSKEDFQKWADDVRLVQQKIKLILNIEEKVNHSDQETLELFEKQGEAKYIVDFVTNSYSALIIDNLLNVVNDPQILSLIFSEREDRYYFARVLSIVGELSKELRDFLNPGQESGLFSFFKGIRDNCLAHFFDVMVHAPSQKTLANFGLLRKLLTTNFVDVLRHIQCQSVKRLGLLSIEEKQELKKLVSSVFYDKPVELNPEFIERISFNQFVQELPQLEGQVQQVRRTVEKEARGSLEALKAIPKKVEKYRKLEGSAKPKDIKLREQIKTEIKDIIIAFNRAVDEKGMHDLKIPFNGVFPSEGDIALLLEKVKEKEEVVFVVTRENKKDKVEVEEVPAEVSVSDSDETLQQSLDKVSKELDFLSNVIQNVRLDDKMKLFVSEFCLSKVGQFFKDLDVKLSKNLKDKLFSNSPGCFHESVKSTTQTRHKLMHDILARHQLPFFERLFRQTLPMLPEVKALQRVLQNKEFSAEGSAFVHLGRAYTVLKQYDKAFECFEKMLSVLDVEESEFGEDPSATHIIEFNATVLNALFGMSEAYGNAAQDEKNKRDQDSAENLYRLKIVYLETYLLFAKNHEKYLGEAMASAYNNLANTFSDIGEYDNAMENHKKAFVLMRLNNVEDLKKQALYLSNAGMTCYFQFLNQRLPSPQALADVSVLVHKAELSTACFWWAKIQYEKACVSKTSLKYLRNFSQLIRSVALCLDVKVALPRAHALFTELCELCDHAVLRADSPDLSEVKDIERVLADMKECASEVSVTEWMAQFERERSRFNLEFEMQNLTNLMKFFAEHLDTSKDFEQECVGIKQRLLEQGNAVSTEALFSWEYGGLVNASAIKFRQGDTQDALVGYQNALKMLRQKYAEFTSKVYVGDLLENIADAYLKLNQKDLGIKYLIEALEAHEQHGPNERAFYIPQKLAKNGFPSVKLLQVSKRALDEFEQREEMSSKFVPLVRIIVVCYIKVGDQQNARKMLLRLPEACRSEQDNFILNSPSPAIAIANLGLHPAPKKEPDKKAKPKKNSRQPTTGGAKPKKPGKRR